MNSSPSPEPITGAAPARAPYSSNATPAQIAARLRSARNIVITTHSKPDGDAAGSTLALARALLLIGATPEVWHVGPFQPWLEPLSAGVRVRRFNADGPAPSEPEPDAIAILDTGSRPQLDVLAPWLLERAERAVIIDHHLSGDAEFAPLRLIDTSAASATQVLVDVIDELLPRDRPLPTPIAEALYLGLGTDTGWFRFSNTTPKTLRLAARLIEAGVDHPALFDRVMSQDAPPRPLLMGAALSSLKYELGGRVAVMQVTLADFKATGAGQEDTGGFAEPVMAVAAVRVAVILTEATRAGDPTPLTKISVRSKPGPGAIDVAAACATIGGGGHARAAGAKVKMSLPEARRAILAALEAALQPGTSPR
ncbi:bifunctional oligoribonuclease/PAP phosphatase NrnA [soil metagenome]